MTDRVPADALVHGSLMSADGVGTVRLECRFDSTVGRVWSALTRPESLGRWLGHMTGGFGIGERFQAHFFATGWEGTALVECCTRDERLRVRTSSAGEPDCVIDVSLAVEGVQTMVAFEDRGLPLEHLAAYGAGDQVLVEDLAAFLAGHGRCDAQARWRALHPGYRKLASALG